MTAHPIVAFFLFILRITRRRLEQKKTVKKKGDEILENEGYFYLISLGDKVEYPHRLVMQIMAVILLI